MFSKFAEENILMLECDIAYIANWYIGQTICQFQVMHYRMLYCAQENETLRIMQYLNYSNYVSFSSWDQDQIGVKLYTKS